MLYITQQHIHFFLFFSHIVFVDGLSEISQQVLGHQSMKANLMTVRLLFLKQHSYFFYGSVTQKKGFTPAFSRSSFIRQNCVQFLDILQNFSKIGSIPIGFSLAFCRNQLMQHAKAIHYKHKLVSIFLKSLLKASQSCQQRQLQFTINLQLIII